MVIIVLTFIDCCLVRLLFFLIKAFYLEILRRGEERKREKREGEKRKGRGGEEGEERRREGSGD